MSKEIKIHCKYDELVSVKKLKDHPKNRNKHGQDQIERLAQLYKYHSVRHPIIVSNLSGFIVAGHGRKLAAIRAGIDKMPVVYQDFENTEAEYAFLISDNAIADWSELDMTSINTDIQDLGPDFNIDMLGIYDFTIDVSEKNEYSQNINSPVYEITGDIPSIIELFDLSKPEELIKKIKKQKLPKEINDFLIYAAYRHTIFDYKKIAEFYAHSDKEVQELMEDSALVIIDFNKAVENGFINLSKELNETYLNNNQ